MPDLPDISNIPYLPSPARDMNWRDLNRFKSSDRGSDFYKTCLDYSQVLWRQRLPARAILCLDRAWGADLTGDEPILESWPLPYQALVYILQNAPTEVFLGNPRIHFQHYADRLGEPRLEQRKWRSWACWALSCKARPDFQSDPDHDVEEPSLEKIAQKLDQYGHIEETKLWKSILQVID